MFKIVFCALFVVAAAKPGIVLTPQLAPLTTTTYLAPATTTITKSASGFISEGPYLYSSPLYAHLIKKRSAPLTYIAPTTYITKPLISTYSAPLLQTAPLIHSAPLLPAASLPIATTHFIKKRSAPVLTTSYIAPTTYSAPWYTSTLTGTAPLVSTPLVSQPVVYASHLIKKRSPGVYSTYSVPSPAINYDYHGIPVNTHGYPLSTVPTAHVYSHIY